MKYPNKWKALSYDGEEVIGYPARRMIDVCTTHDEAPCYRTSTLYVWDMYVCKRDVNFVTVSGDSRIYYTSKPIPIMGDTLVEITDDKRGEE